MGKNFVRITIVATLVCVYAVFGIPEVFYADAYWPRAFSYSLFHASWWHLAVNGIAVWTIYRQPCKPCRDLLIPYFIAIAVYPLSLRPVLGFSNVLYAVLGLRTPPLNSPWWRQSSVIFFLLITVAMLFIPRFSATTHIAAFVAGMGCAAIGRGWKKLNSDAKRYY